MISLSRCRILIQKGLGLFLSEELTWSGADLVYGFWRGWRDWEGIGGGGGW